MYLPNKSLKCLSEKDLTNLSIKYLIKESLINLNFATAFDFVRCNYFAVLVLTHFLLTKGRVRSFRPETVIANFLHLMLFVYKVIFNHSH